MIKRTLYFGNPAYLSKRDEQLVIKLPEIVKNDTLPDSFKQKSLEFIIATGYNAYCLADDVMESYRPYVDNVVCDIARHIDFLRL
jgi:CRISPR/Cas system-associated endonuclease Cas1